MSTQDKYKELRSIIKNCLTIISVDMVTDVFMYY